AEDGIRDRNVTGVQTCALPILSENEGAKFWLGVLTELQNRGVQDILIACVDGLKGFPDAINTVYPKAKVQLCIVHMVRYSMKFRSEERRVGKVCGDSCWRGVMK